VVQTEKKVAFFRSIALALVAAALVSAEDPVVALNRRIDRGEVQLAFDHTYGYLPSLLRALGVPVESQISVFSKTSIQAMRIEPSNPRVLYFNDSVVVGWVRGGFIELAALDPGRGINYYTIQQRSNERLENRRDCVRCHTSGLALLRSVTPSLTGIPSDEKEVDDRTPFSKLWGGWFVTGKSVPALHLGNAVVEKAARREIAPAFDAKGSLTASSDVAALMVFAHQMRAWNLLTRPENADELADHLVFADESPLPGAVEGGSAFAEKFAAAGPRDAKGRSLRDFGRQGRLMRYPCSYMIYSDAFAALPEGAKAAVYLRMWKVLGERESSEDRKAVAEILGDTKQGLPEFFRGAR
jgi:hypothetical protein